MNSLNSEMVARCYIPGNRAINKRTEKDLRDSVLAVLTYTVRNRMGYLHMEVYDIIREMIRGEVYEDD